MYDLRIAFSARIRPGADNLNRQLLRTTDRRRKVTFMKEVLAGRVSRSTDARVAETHQRRNAFYGSEARLHETQ